MSEIELRTDVALGVTIPARDARGRIARLGPVVDAVLANHGYPPLIEKLLAEALTLTALLGSLLKEPPGPDDAAGADAGRDRRPDGVRLSRAASCAAMSATTASGWPTRR